MTHWSIFSNTYKDESLLVKCQKQVNHPITKLLQNRVILWQNIKLSHLKPERLRKNDDQLSSSGSRCRES